jgi:hypothetical protein
VKKFHKWTPFHHFIWVKLFETYLIQKMEKATSLGTIPMEQEMRKIKINSQKLKSKEK